MAEIDDRIIAAAEIWSAISGVSVEEAIGQILNEKLNVVCHPTGAHQREISVDGFVVERGNANSIC